MDYFREAFAAMRGDGKVFGLPQSRAKKSGSCPGKCSECGKTCLRDDDGGGGGDGG